MFIAPLRIEKIPGRSKDYVLLSDLIYQSGEYFYTVPKGFRTDLTTGWYNGRNTEASVLHDYLLHDLGYTFKAANQIMLLAMISSGVRPWHRRLIYAGVTVYGIWKDYFMWIKTPK